MIVKGILFLAVLATFGCSAQKPRSLKQVDAFFQVRVPGTIPIVTEGSESARFIDTLYLIYIQVDDSSTEWKKAWSSDCSYSIETSKIADTPVFVGIRKSTTSEIRLLPTKGRQLYKLLLRRDAAKTESPFLVKSGQLLLQGQEHGKEVFYPVREIVELHSPLHE